MKGELLIFWVNKLLKNQPLYGYKELVEFTIIFLGQTPPNGTFFKVAEPIWTHIMLDGW